MPSQYGQGGYGAGGYGTGTGTSRLGTFDPELRAFIDPDFLIEGWFDPDLIDQIEGLTLPIQPGLSTEWIRGAGWRVITGQPWPDIRGTGRTVRRP